MFSARGGGIYRVYVKKRGEEVLLGLDYGIRVNELHLD